MTSRRFLIRVFAATGLLGVGAFGAAADFTRKPIAPAAPVPLPGTLPSLAAPAPGLPASAVPQAPAASQAAAPQAQAPQAAENAPAASPMAQLQESALPSGGDTAQARAEFQKRFDGEGKKSDGGVSAELLSLGERVGRAVTRNEGFTLVPWEKRWAGDRPAWRLVEDGRDLKLHYVPADLQHPDANVAMARLMQEVFRAVYSKPGLVDPALKSNGLFETLHDAVETGRVMRKGLRERPGLKGNFDAFHEDQYGEAADPKAAEKVAALPPYLRFLEGLLYEGRTGKEDPRQDERMRELLEQNRPAREALASATPEESYKASRELWPLLQKLYAESEDAALSQELFQKAAQEESEKKQSRWSKRDALGLDKDEREQAADGDLKLNELDQERQQEMRRKLQELWDKLTPEQKEELQRQARKKLQDQEREFKKSMGRSPQKSKEEAERERQELTQDLQDLARQMSKDASEARKQAKKASRLEKQAQDFQKKADQISQDSQDEESNEQAQQQAKDLQREARDVRWSEEASQQAKDKADQVKSGAQKAQEILKQLQKLNAEQKGQQQGEPQPQPGQDDEGQEQGKKGAAVPGEGEERAQEPGKKTAEGSVGSAIEQLERLKSGGLDAKQREFLKDFFAPINGMVETLASKLAKRLRATTLGRTLTGLDQGDIDEDALPYYKTPGAAIMSEELLPGRKRARLTLIIDMSRSMGSLHDPSATLYHASRALGLGLKAMARAYRNHPDIEVRVVGYNAEASIPLLGYTKASELTDAVIYKVIKALDIERYSGTKDIETLEEAVADIREDMKRRPDTAFAVLHMGDGNLGKFHVAGKVARIYKDPGNADIRFGNLAAGPMAEKLFTDYKPYSYWAKDVRELGAAWAQMIEGVFKKVWRAS